MSNAFYQREVPQSSLIRLRVDWQPQPVRKILCLKCPLGRKSHSSSFQVFLLDCQLCRKSSTVYNLLNSVVSLHVPELYPWKKVLSSCTCYILLRVVLHECASKFYELIHKFLMLQVIILARESGLKLELSDIPVQSLVPDLLRVRILFAPKYSVPFLLW